ncbi:hypothetical protein L1049_004579 [Liquidambar formosana]|uniref:Pentatricopeptide repeat-containing protein n=1 Tax=Liquidambar formosana TaxID=63359 RepID=A0AAP0RTM0_LIQFO
MSCLPRTMPTLDRILRPTTSRHICTLSTANLNYSISGNIHNGCLNDARKLFDENPTTRNVVSWNTMITAYVRNDQMRRAQELFDQMPIRDVVSWNALLSGLHRTKHPEGVYQFFLQMGRAGLRPNEFTMSIVISSVLNTAFSVLIPQFHAHIVCLALNSSVYVGSALMRGYANLGHKLALCRVFDEILVKDVSSWNALILSYMDLGCTGEAHRAFETMPEKNIVSWTTLVNGYIRNKKINKARSVFNKMTERNVVSWTVMISGYVQNVKFLDALKLFLLMSRSGAQPNNFTLSSVLDACAGCSSLVMGMQVHSRILKSGITKDVILSTSLVDMYAKCGDIEAAFCIFESMPKKNVVSWNSIIGGYARHGLGTRALEEFERMTKGGVTPDQVTFINVLSACGHGGLVEQGMRHFNSMGTKYGIEAGMEHYACMVDLFGRAGQLEKAEKVIKEMPFEPDVVVWGALLGACGLHSCLELGEFAAYGIYKLEKDHPAIYLMLSKIHGEKGVWSSVIELRKMVKESHAKKQKAGSWIESPLGVR